jgi:hypothetical protein
MAKVALAIEEDYESSIELRPFSLLINAIKAEQTRGNITHACTIETS